MTEQRQKVLEEKRHVSIQISDLCRYIGFGVVAVVWTMLTASSDFASNVTANYRISLLLSASAGILTIFFDYLQFLAGYVSVNKALSSDNNSYDKNWKSYKLRIFFFWAKQFSAVIGILILVWIVLSNI